MAIFYKWTMPSGGQKESKKAELIQIDAEIQNSQKELETVLSEFEMATSNEYEWNTRQVQWT